MNWTSAGARNKAEECRVLANYAKDTGHGDVAAIIRADLAIRYDALADALERAELRRARREESAA